MSGAAPRPQQASRARRLLWVNHFAAAPDMGGGTRHVELGRELAARGWDVRIAASDFHLHRRQYLRRAGAHERETRAEVIDGVQMRWLWTSPYDRNDHHRVANWLRFSAAISRLGENECADVVIGSSPHLFAALGAWRLARRWKVPFVLEVRDLWPETLAANGRRHGPGYHALGALARFLYRRADRIIVLARGVESHLRGQGVAPRRMVYVPNGVDAAAFASSRPAARERLRLVYAGAHGPLNGLSAVMEAAALLRDEPRVSFRFVGDGPAKPGLREMADRLRLETVAFDDPVPKSRIPGLFADCDAGLMVLREVPVFAFGVSPNKLFDYWGAALPVVCNVPGEVAGWVAASGGGVQAIDSSAHALAASIRALLARHPAERRAMGERGLSWVTREHDRPVLAARLDAALRGLVHSREEACVS